MSDRYRYIFQTDPLDYLDKNRSEYDITVRFELATGCFDNIITSLPERKFDFEKFKELYHLRWDGKNLSRDHKYPLCLKAFHSKKYEYIVQEICARAILHSFITAIISQVDINSRGTKYEY